MMRKTILFKNAAATGLGLLLRAGCAANVAWQDRPSPKPGPSATEEGYRAMLETWVPGMELTLVREWGAPSSVYIVGEHKFMVYKNHELHYNPDVRIEADVPKVDYRISCTTTFEVAGGKVLHYQYTGSACQAIAFPAIATAVSGSAKP